MKFVQCYPSPLRLEPFQSGLQPFQTLETAVFKVINDLFTSAPSGILDILCLLDLNAAFHTVCHSNPWTELCRHHTGLDYFLSKWQCTFHRSVWLQLHNLCCYTRGILKAQFLVHWLWHLCTSSQICLNLACLLEIKTRWQTFSFRSTNWDLASYIYIHTQIYPLRLMTSVSLSCSYCKPILVILHSKKNLQNLHLWNITKLKYLSVRLCFWIPLQCLCL